MKTELFGAKFGQQRVLFLLVVSLLAAVFEPTLKWALFAPMRRGLVENGRLQVLIPRAWLVESNSSNIVAWKPCLTIFCLSPKASFKIVVEPELIGDDSAWKSGTEALLQGKKLLGITERAFVVTGGKAYCAEGVYVGRAKRKISTCLIPTNGIVGGFEGVASELGEFYQIVQTARLVSNEE